MKKLISLTLIVFVVVLSAAPFVQKSECDMPCCNQEIDPYNSVNSQQECSGAIFDCADVIFIPLVTAPLLKFQQEHDFFLDYTYCPERIISTEPTISLIEAYIPELNSNPAYNIPLRI